MNQNIQALLKACEKLSVSYDVRHQSGNVVWVDGRLPFVNWTTPMNSQSIARLCTDKEYTYECLNELVSMPRTESYLSPFVADAYLEYLKFSDLDAVISDVLATFQFPIIVKANGGSHGTNVFKCDTRDELGRAVHSVFNVKSKDYDYVLLAQDYVQCNHEYRVIWLDGKIEFAYDKGLSWTVGEKVPRAERLQDATAAVVDDPQLLDDLQKLLSPLKTLDGLRFCGVDVIQDLGGNFLLIELNASPGFDYFVRSNGNQRVVELYVKMLRSLVC